MAKEGRSQPLSVTEVGRLFFAHSKTTRFPPKRLCVNRSVAKLSRNAARKYVLAVLRIIEGECDNAAAMSLIVCERNGQDGSMEK
jgi:hypothetical protein